MSFLSELELLFNKLDKTIDMRVKQINYVHDKNILAINKRFDLECIDSNNNNVNTKNSHNTLSNIREKMITKVSVSLKRQMHILDKILEDEINLGIMTSDLNTSREEFLAEIDENLAKQTRYVFKTSSHFQHIPFNMMDILCPNRFERKVTKDLSTRSLISHWNAITKQLVYDDFELQVQHNIDEYNRVRDVISLNNNNFLIVIATNRQRMLASQYDRIKLLNFKNQHSVKLNIAIGSPFSIRYADYKILAPKHTDRIVIKFREGGWNIGFKTFIHVYDYKLNLLFSKIFDEYLDDILIYKRLILFRSIDDRKLIFMNFLLQVLHVCDLESKFDNYHLKHFNCSMVYFNKVCEGRFYPASDDFLDELVIFDYFNKKVVKSISFLFKAMTDAFSSEWISNLQLGLLISFDRESNIYMFDNFKQLFVYNKTGELILTLRGKDLLKTLRTMELMKRVSIGPDAQYEYSVIRAYKMN